MSLWNTVEDEVTAIEAALVAVPPNVHEAQQLAAALAQKVKYRTSSAPRVFSVDELGKAVEHLSFEMQHFRCYNKLYRNDDLSRFSPAANQAVLYAFLLHLRLLIDFFYGEARQDDWNVDHFNVLDGFEAAFPASIHVHTELSRKTSANLNKLLAHMTATRWESARAPMADYERFIPTIDDLITRFEAALPEELRQVYSERYGYWELCHPAAVLRPA